MRALPSIGWALFAVVVSLSAPIRGDELAIPATPETETTKRIRAALDGLWGLDPKLIFDQAPLNNVIQKIAEHHKIPIELDERAMQDAGIGSDVPVSFRPLAKVSLKAALRVIVRQNELTWLIKDERLVITTKAAADDIALNGVTRLYQVTDLCPVHESSNRFLPPSVTAHADSLLQCISGLIDPYCWSDVGGSCSIRPFYSKNDTIIVVSASQATHESIESLLRDLRLARELQRKPDERYQKLPGGVPASVGGAAIHEYEKRLRERYKVEAMQNVPLQEAIAKLSDAWGIEMALDVKALGDADVQVDCPINITGGTFTAAAILEACLRSNGLTWIIKDELVDITTRAAADDIAQNGEIRVYPVADLICGTWQNDVAVGDYDQLIQLIAATVAPTTWEFHGGSSSNCAFTAAGALVFCHTRLVHDEIAELLTSLRRTKLPQNANPPQAAPAGLQVRVFTIPVIEPPPPVAPKNEAAPKPNGQTSKRHGILNCPQGDLPIQAQLGGLGGGPGNASPSRSMTEAIQVAKELSETIPQLIALKSWKGAGGEGSIHAVGNQILVRQEAGVIDEIEELLEAMGVGQRRNLEPFGGGGFF